VSTFTFATYVICSRDVSEDMGREMRDSKCSPVEKHFFFLKIECPDHKTAVSIFSFFFSQCESRIQRKSQETTTQCL